VIRIDRVPQPETICDQAGCQQQRVVVERGKGSEPGQHIEEAEDGIETDHFEAHAIGSIVEHGDNRR
jgi:hypothetical protein